MTFLGSYIIHIYVAKNFSFLDTYKSLKKFWQEQSEGKKIHVAPTM